MLKNQIFIVHEHPIILIIILCRKSLVNKSFHKLIKIIINQILSICFNS